MIVQKVNNLWVNFDNAVSQDQLPNGFLKERAYPVFSIDVVDNDDNSKDTSFLLAGRDGKFCWINTAFLRRSSKPPMERRPYLGNNPKIGSPIGESSGPLAYSNGSQQPIMSSGPHSPVDLAGLPKEE